MSTLSSWIDPAEISKLMPFLLPQEGGEGTASAEEKAGRDHLASDPETESGEPAETVAEGTPEGADQEGVETSFSPSTATGPTAGPIETIEVIDARDGVPSVPGNSDPTDSDLTASPNSDSVEPEPETPAANAEIDFNTPEAYDAAAFPESGELPDAATSPGHQAAAVQAAVALEHARSRADEVGLLKKNQDDDSQSVESPEAKPGSESAMETVVEKPSVIALEDPPIPPATDEIEDAPDSPESLTGKDEASAESEPEPEPGTFRYRLANFARNAVKLTGGSDLAVTDFQSYPLYPGANGNLGASPQALESILRMHRLISEFPGQSGNGESTTQIALGEEKWLCILTRDSASGGVCASLRVTAPFTKETAAQLHQELGAALAVSPV